MNDDPSFSKKFEELRYRAEQLIEDQAGNTPEPSADPLELIHELKLHQAELEIQNEELQQAQQALSQIKQEYEDLYEFAPFGYLKLDAKGIIRLANLTAVTLLGTNRRFLLGMGFSLFVRKGWEHLYSSARDNAIETGEKQSTELLIGKDDESALWVRADIEADPDETGALVSWRIVLVDITAQRRAEEDKKQMEDKFRQVEKARSLSRMAGAVAHHFNNMLAVIIGNLDLARVKLPPDSDIVEDLSKAEASANRAVEMSHLMLTYLGQEQKNPHPMDFATACREYIHNWRGHIPDKVRLYTHLPDSGPVVTADQKQIEKVFRALVTNSEEAMEDRDDGTINISMDTMNAAEINYRNCFPKDWKPSADEYAVLIISDTGKGIDENAVELIFDPFYTDKFTGRGIGLAVVLGIVKAHDGCISVESMPGSGSTFRIFLPLTPDVSPVEKPSKENRVYTEGKGRKVLVADDHPMLRETVEAILKNQGFEVLIAKDGAEALEIFREKYSEIELIISDLTMPRMNGWETLQAARKVRPDIPFILTSGHEEAMVMDTVHNENPDAFLQKPFDINALKEALIQALV
ncbi:MAG: hybrid sensor histidine kinase/response regulator [Thermodesulfobacteriota bacterium]